jgi:phage-related protein
MYHNIAIIKMPPVKVLLFRNERGECPILDWFDALPAKVGGKALDRIKELSDLGHELRRPQADYLRDGIYELRWRNQAVNYRNLYFFYGRSIVVTSHGLTKEDVVPVREIDRAVKNKKLFESNPHRFSGVL